MLDIMVKGCEKSKPRQGRACDARRILVEGVSDLVRVS